MDVRDFFMPVCTLWNAKGQKVGLFNGLFSTNSGQAKAIIFLRLFLAKESTESGWSGTFKVENSIFTSSRKIELTWKNHRLELLEKPLKNVSYQHQNGLTNESIFFLQNAISFMHFWANWGIYNWYHGCIEQIGWHQERQKNGRFFMLRSNFLPVRDVIKGSRKLCVREAANKSKKRVHFLLLGMFYDGKWRSNTHMHSRMNTFD